MKTVMLADVAHARAGDKGDSSILFVAPNDPADFEQMLAGLTQATLAAHFAIANASTICIRPVAALSAVSIVLPHRLDGGVTRSITIDPHGKTLSGHLLQMSVPWDGEA